MEFEVTEIKMLGYGIGRSISLRLDATPDFRSTGQNTGVIEKSRYTVHAVVPFSPEFGTVQVGQKFKLERTEVPLSERVVQNEINYDEYNNVNPPQRKNRTEG